MAFLILLALIPQLAGWLLVNHSLDSHTDHRSIDRYVWSNRHYVVISCVLFNEKVILHQWVGCTIILSGIAYIQLMNNRSHLEPSESLNQYFTVF